MTTRASSGDKRYRGVAGRLRVLQGHVIIPVWNGLEANLLAPLVAYSVRTHPTLSPATQHSTSILITDKSRGRDQDHIPQTMLELTAPTTVNETPLQLNFRSFCKAHTASEHSSLDG